MCWMTRRLQRCCGRQSAASRLTLVFSTSGFAETTFASVLTVLAVTHSDTYVIGDAHTNTCENRHSFLRQWLAKFRGVSKHHLQKYLGFFGLKLNSPNDWFEKLLCYDVSG